MDVAVVAQAGFSCVVRLAASPSGEMAAAHHASLPHVLLALDEFSTTLGGGERVALRLARLLPSLGFRVSILVLSLNQQSPALNDPPCPIYLLPLQRTWDLAALRAARHLRRFLKEEQVSIVQTFFESSDLWTGGVARTVPGVRVIWSRRDMGILRGRKHATAYRLMRNLPDRVLAVSEEVRRHCIEVDGIPSDRVETLYNGIDLPSPEEASAARFAKDTVMGGVKGATIVSVGNLRPVKGFHILLEAAIGVLRQFPDTTFQIAGAILEPQYHTAMLQRVQDAGIGDRFLFLGNVTDVRGLLRQADIFVLPSLSEGFSNAIVEAMACSLPVVATRVGGNAEAVLDGVTGHIVPVEDAVALGDALGSLLADPATARGMGAAGMERAASLFTTEAMLSRLVGLYRALLSAERPR